MVSANIIVSVSLLSVAAIAALAIVYTSGGEEVSTIGGLCDAIYELEGEAYDEVKVWCEGLDEEYSGVGVEEALPCDGGDGGTDETWTLGEILLNDDPSAALDTVMDRCITDEWRDELAAAVTAAEDRRSLQWAERELGKYDKIITYTGNSNGCIRADGVQGEDAGPLPSYGHCGDKCSSNICHGALNHNMRGLTSYCSDGEKGGERCKNKISWKCCADHDEELGDGSLNACSKNGRKEADQRLRDCAGGKVCRSGHWWCQSYTATIRQIFRFTPNAAESSGAGCNSGVCVTSMKALKYPSEHQDRYCRKRRWGRCRSYGYKGAGYTNTGGKW